MDIVLLILATLIFSKTSKQFEKTEIRLMAGSILGIFYFIIWPYTYYYTQLLVFPEIYIQLIFAALLGLIFLLISVLIKITFYEIINLLTISLFLISWGLSSTYEVHIKDKIADYTGYFSAQLDSELSQTDLLTKEVNSHHQSFSVLIPESWKVYKHTGTHQPFFRPTLETSSIIEFRPGCNDQQLVAITDLTTNYSRIHQPGESAKHQCYHWNEQDYACRIEISDTSGINRIRWVGTNKDRHRLLALDFVLNNGSEQDWVLIDAIFKSIRFKGFAEDAGNCPTSVEWF